MQVGEGGRAVAAQPWIAFLSATSRGRKGSAGDRDSWPAATAKLLPSPELLAGVGKAGAAGHTWLEVSSSFFVDLPKRGREEVMEFLPVRGDTGPEAIFPSHMVPGRLPKSTWWARARLAGWRGGSGQGWDCHLGDAARSECGGLTSPGQLQS